METPDKKFFQPCRVVLEPITPAGIRSDFSIELKKVINERNMLSTKTRRKVTEALDELTRENQMKKRKQNKQRLTAEILQSEESYIKQLETVMDFFAKPAQEKGLLKQNDFEILFGNIEGIYTINQELLSELQKGPSNISEAFSKIAPFFKSYALYALDFKKSLQILQNCDKTSPKFASFLEKQESRPEVQSKLSALLIAPIQRVPRYKLLLESLLDLTETNDEYKSLEESLRKVELAAVHINRIIEEQENMQKLIELQRCMQKGEPNVIAPGKILIKEGHLMKISSKSGRSKKLHVVLMNDKLLFCKMTKDELKVDSLKCSQIFPLNKCKVIPVIDKGAFRVICQDDEILLYHERLDETNEWIEEIKYTIKSHLEDRKTLRKESSARRPVKRKDVGEYNEVGVSPGQKLKKRRWSYQEEEPVATSSGLVVSKRPALRSRSQPRHISFQMTPPSYINTTGMDRPSSSINTNGTSQDLFIFGGDNAERSFNFKMGKWLGGIGSTMKKFFGFK